MTNVNPFFNFSPYRINPVLKIAIDTLRRLNKRENFADTFIKENGLPAWNTASVFMQEGRPVILVPVYRPVENEVTGILYISIIDKDPVFRWIQRGANITGKGLPDKQKLEELMLIHEHQLFGTVQKQGVAVKSRREKIAPRNPVKQAIVSEYDWIRISWEVCGNVDFGGDGTYGPDQCDTYYEWVRVEVISDGGFPNGGGGGDGGDDTGAGPGGGGGSSGGSGDGNCAPTSSSGPSLTNGDGQAVECEEETTDAWEAQIDDSELKPCMQDIMDTLKKNYVGSLSENYLGVGEIVQLFAGEVPVYNWKMLDEDLPEGVNGRTSVHYDRETGTVITVFDTDKFSQASNLAVARTIMHEAIHAYVVATQFSKVGEEYTAEDMEILLGLNWMKAVYNNNDHHQYMAESFRNQIAVSLSLLASMNGQSVGLFPTNFFDDMAWGGLTIYKNEDGEDVEYDFFTNTITDASERERIKITINIEQYGRDKNGNYRNQEGKDAGC